ncbi:hypothetical protein WT24_19980 [Burkholderia sp. MSMB1078WGS]|nr:hypothetical protein WT24_19980 [Burkholderia sp. MSMB1078WGS]
MLAAMVPGFAVHARVAAGLHGGAATAARAVASKALRFRGRWITLCDAAAPESRATRHVMRPGESGRRLSGPAGPLSRAPAAGP